MKVQFVDTVKMDRWRRAYSVVRALFVLTAIFNFASLTITSFLITSSCAMTGGMLCVAEANPYPAFIFDNFGIPAMYLILGLIWAILFGLTLWIKEKDIRVAVIMNALIVGFLLPGILLDFFVNVNVISLVIFQS